MIKSNPKPTTHFLTFETPIIPPSDDFLITRGTVLKRIMEMGYRFPVPLTFSLEKNLSRSEANG